MFAISKVSPSRATFPRKSSCCSSFWSRSRRVPSPSDLLQTKSCSTNLVNREHYTASYRTPITCTRIFAVRSATPQLPHGQTDSALYTAGELSHEIDGITPGTRIAIRYQRRSTIYDNCLVVNRAEPGHGLEFRQK